jgi:hypothetical protein
LYKFPHNEQANLTKRKRLLIYWFEYFLINIPALASSGSGTRRYRAGSTDTL